MRYRHGFNLFPVPLSTGCFAPERCLLYRPESQRMRRVPTVLQPLRGWFDSLSVHPCARFT